MHPDGDEMPCGEPGIPCCSEPFACNGPNSPCNNYDPDFQDTGGCDLSCTAGCMDEEAQNYDPDADYEDGTCVYSNSDTTVCELLTFDGNGDGMVNYQDFLGFLGAYGVADLDGDCIEDSVDDNVCIGCGCTDPEAGNYNPEAVIEDGSCVYGPSECGGVSTVMYDGYTYDLVAIGEQCWFAENLRNEHYANGDAIPGELSNSEWQIADDTNLGAQAIYNNDVSNLADYGRLYNWYAVDDGRGLCPSVWHVPTDGEFMTLEMELGMSESEANGTGERGTDQGAQMKSSPEDSPSWNGTNTSGFSGLAGGIRSNNASFSLEDGAYFWSDSADGTSAWYRVLGGNTRVSRTSNDRRNGFSVRCVRD